MTGSITIERILDVETMTTEYSLTVLAMDGGDPPRRYCMTAILDSNIMSRAYIDSPSKKRAYATLYMQTMP